MTEYIERDAISEEIRKYYYKNPPNFFYGEGFDRGLDRAQRAILDAPAADVVEVVRCKDCIRRYDTDECPMCFLIEGKYYEYTNENGFCDRGERKEGAE